MAQDGLIPLLDEAEKLASDILALEAQEPSPEREQALESLYEAMTVLRPRIEMEAYDGLDPELRKALAEASVCLSYEDIAVYASNSASGIARVVSIEKLAREYLIRAKLEPLGTKVLRNSDAQEPKPSPRRARDRRTQRQAKTKAGRIGY